MQSLSVPEFSLFLKTRLRNRPFSQSDSISAENGPSSARENESRARLDLLHNHFWSVIENYSMTFGECASSSGEYRRIQNLRLRAVAGSHKKAFDSLVEQNGEALFNRAQGTRKGDLLVYFALGQLGKRKPYNHMPAGLQRDLKVFFATYNEAIKEATKLLFAVGKANNISIACEEAQKILDSSLVSPPSNEIESFRRL